MHQNHRGGVVTETAESREKIVRIMFPILAEHEDYCLVLLNDKGFVLAHSNCLQFVPAGSKEEARGVVLRGKNCKAEPPIVEKLFQEAISDLPPPSAICEAERFADCMDEGGDMVWIPRKGIAIPEHTTGLRLEGMPVVKEIEVQAEGVKCSLVSSLLSHVAEVDDTEGMVAHMARGSVAGTPMTVISLQKWTTQQELLRLEFVVALGNKTQYMPHLPFLDGASVTLGELSGALLTHLGQHPGDVSLPVTIEGRGEESWNLVGASVGHRSVALFVEEHLVDDAAASARISDLEQSVKELHTILGEHVSPTITDNEVPEVAA